MATEIWTLFTGLRPKEHQKFEIWLVWISDCWCSVFWSSLFIFHFSGVPIALCCIAPMLAAKVFGSEGVHITLGKKGDETKVLTHFTDKLDRFAWSYNFCFIVISLAEHLIFALDPSTEPYGKIHIRCSGFAAWTQRAYSRIKVIWPITVITLRWRKLIRLQNFSLNFYYFNSQYSYSTFPLFYFENKKEN